jgi:hypothetical protein
MGLVNLVPGQYCNIHDVQTVIPEVRLLGFPNPHTRVWGFNGGGGEELRLQSREDQELSAVAVPVQTHPQDE